MTGGDRPHDDAPAPPVLGAPAGCRRTTRRWRRPCADGLDGVDALLTEAVEHDDPFIAERRRHLVTAGGKRFRPLLTLLAAELGDGIDADVVARPRPVVELTHLASLYHDDVMDEAGAAPRRARAPTRRTTTPSRSWSATCSSAARPRSSPTSAREAVQIQAETFVRLCTGQIRDDRPGRRRARTRSTTTSACSPTRPARSSRPPAATARCSAAARRRGGRDHASSTASGSAWPSSSPTTSSTSPPRPGSPARRPAPTCARASRPCRCCSRRASTDPADAACASCSTAT